MKNIIGLAEKTGEELREICRSMGLSFYPNTHRTDLIFLIAGIKPAPSKDEVEESNKWQNRDWSKMPFEEFPEQVKKALRAWKAWAINNPAAFQRHKDESMRTDGEWSIWPAVVRTSPEDHRPKVITHLSMCEGVSHKDRIFRWDEIL